MQCYLGLELGHWIELKSWAKEGCLLGDRREMIANWVSEHVNWQWGTWVLVQLRCGEAEEGIEEIWEEGPHDSWVMHSQTQLMFLSDTWLELYGAMAKTPQ